MSYVNPFLTLNANLIVKILGNLSAIEFLHCIATCKLLRKFVSHDEIVSKICHNRLNEIMPIKAKQMIETMVIPRTDLFSCVIVPTQLFHTIDFNAIGLSNYTKYWFLTCMIIDVNTITISTKKTVNGYHTTDDVLFIGTIKIEYSCGFLKKRYINGLRINDDSIMIGMCNQPILYNIDCKRFKICHDYIGYVMGGNQHIKGIQIFYDGDIYEGEYYYGYKHGYGKLKSIYGNTYEGDWNKDILYGNCILTTTYGTKYIGKWKDNTYFGSGTIYHIDGSSWSGMWLNSIPTSNNALHEDIRNLINNDQCTKILADVPGKYCQILYKYKFESINKYICQSCLNTCYYKSNPVDFDDNKVMLAHWTMGRHICKCSCKNN